MGTVTFKIEKYQGVSSKPNGLSLQDIVNVLINTPPHTGITSIKGEFGKDSLSVLYTLELHNSIFKDGEELLDNTKWSRGIGFDDDSKNVKEFNSQEGWNIRDIVNGRDK